MQTGTPPAILIGGAANTLAGARSMGHAGIRCAALTVPGRLVRYSRFADWIETDGSRPPQEAWLEWLLTEGARRYPGAVLLPFSDDAVELIARHRAELTPHFVPIDGNDAVTLSMLDKQESFQLARKADVPAPLTFPVASREELLAQMGRIVYPCAIKPRHTHKWREHFPNIKLFEANGPDELLKIYDRVEPYGLHVSLTEIIPGAEDQFSAYYTYLTAEGEPLFHFTKRKLRQYPYRFGLGTCHLTDWNPEVKEMGLRFLSQSGYQGMAAVEFKRDPRDGQLKFIECNARFTYLIGMVTVAGLDCPLVAYNHLTGRPLPPVDRYTRGVLMVRHLDDFLAFREAHREGRLGWGEYLRSLWGPRAWEYFAADDPLPFLVHMSDIAGRLGRKALRVAGLQPQRAGTPG